jgi:hypothetical protein
MGSGGQAAGLDAGQVIRWRSWPRWTAICLVAYIYLAVALRPQEDASSDVTAGLIPITVRSCCGSCATRPSGHSCCIRKVLLFLLSNWGDGWNRL